VGTQVALYSSLGNCVVEGRQDPPIQTVEKWQQGAAVAVPCCFYWVGAMGFCPGGNSSSSWDRPGAKMGLDKIGVRLNIF
jgi:hypothetical protein